MIMIKLRMFSFNFAYTIMSDILYQRIERKLLFNEKFTNYQPQRKTAKAFLFL